jgi:hypothetical protein
MSSTVLTLAQIKTKLNDYLDSLDITRTIVIESLVNLLSYSIYVDETNRLSLITQMSLPLSTSINSKIFHASNNLYSVNRGSLSRVKYNNIESRATEISVKKLDLDTTYNGYNFYYNEDKELKSGLTTKLEFIISKNKLIEGEVFTSDSKTFIDILDSDVSEDLWLYDDSNKLLNCTNDPYEFFSTTKYDYLIITIKNYGFRIIRNIAVEDQSDSTTPWSTSKFYYKYFKYDSSTISNTIFDNVQFNNFKTSSTTRSYVYTDRIERDNNLTLLTNNIIRYQSSRDIICTKNHLKSFIDDLIDRYEIKSDEDIGTEGHYTTNTTYYYIEDNKDTDTSTIFLLDSNGNANLDAFKIILDEALETMKKSIRLQMINFNSQIITSNKKIVTYKIVSDGGLTQEMLTNLANNYNKNKINTTFYVSNMVYDIQKLLSNDSTIRVYQIKESDSGEEVEEEQLLSNKIDIKIDNTTGVWKFYYIELKL